MNTAHPVKLFLQFELLFFTLSAIFLAAPYFHANLLSVVLFFAVLQIIYFFVRFHYNFSLAFIIILLSLLAFLIPDLRNGFLEKWLIIFFISLFLCFAYTLLCPWLPKLFLLEKRVRQSLQNLNAEIFFIILQGNYSDDRFFYEKNWQQKKKAYLRCALRLPEKSRDKSEKVFTALLACAQLPRRVTDDSIRLCYNEMTKLAEALQAAWKNKQFGASEDALAELDDVYQHVLQTTAREPLAWLLFMHDVKELLAAMREYFEEERSA